MKAATSRRQFLGRSAAGAAGWAAGVAAGPLLAPARVLGRTGGFGANGKIQIGMIGVGGMGTSHLRTVLGQEDARVVAVCDVRREHRERARGLVEMAYGEASCALYGDFRELLARPDIDAVCLAVPDHWHVLVGLEAARQGKAMYYEKPMGLTVEEAQAMRAAVRRHGVIFQFGTQQRSDAFFRYAVELVRNGYVGALRRIVTSSASFNAVPPQAEEAAPEGLDYAMWLGPAPWAPYTTLRCTRQWTLIRDYSLGCLSGAWGIHHVDIAQWAMEADEGGPVEVEGTGTIPAEGLFDTYQHFEVEHTYANGVKLLHIDHVTGRKRIPQLNREASMGILFEGEEGWVYVAREHLDAEPKSLLRTVLGPNARRLPVSNNHWRNFLDAVRRGTDPICPVGPGVKSEMVCQQAEIALRLGRRLRWDNQREEFVDQPEANRLLRASLRGPWRI